MPDPNCLGHGRRTIMPLGMLLLTAFSGSATAAEGAAAPDRPVVLDAVVVTGVQPGPGLWRISRGDGVVWVLGTVSPLPRDIEWNSSEVEKVLADADEVIAPASVRMDIGAGDVFKMATLARSANAALKLPDGRTLRDEVSRTQYARWTELKAAYLPGDDKVERQRPMFASQDLYYSAIEVSGLTRVDSVWSRVSRLAADAGVRIVDTEITSPLAIDRKAYRDGIRALAESRIDDVSCFELTMDSLAPALGHMVAAANAWSVGDMEALAGLPIDSIVPPCKAVYDAAMSFQQRPELAREALSEWQAAVQASLASGRTALAVLPIADLAGDDGVLAALEAAGYDVESPAP